MFINHLIVAIVFKFINFAIFITLVGYLFKKYVLPMAYALMSKKESEKELLLNQQLYLERKQSELGDLMRQDSVLCEGLKVKVDTWKKVVDHVNFMQKENHLERVVFLERKNMKIREFQEESRIKSVVAKAVVSDLQDSLKKHFERDHHGEEYLNVIIQIMSEKTL